MTRAQAIFILIFIALTGIIFWVWNHSFLVISAEGSTGGADIRYEITKQGTDEVSVVDTKDKTIRKLVTRGTYQVTITSDNSNGVSFIGSKSFLRSQDIKTPLSPERSRTFVGNTPGFCTYYGEVLYSYDCNSTYDGLKRHIPATADTPTYTESPSDGAGNTIRGIFTADAMPYVFMEADVEGDTIAKFATPLKTDLTYTGGQIIKDLDPQTSYNILPYKNGAVAYTKDFGEAKLVQGSAFTTTTIKLMKPDEKTPHGASISALKNQLAFLYNENEEGEDADVDSENHPAQKGRSQVVIYTNESNPQSYSLPKPYTSLQLCATNTLCATISGNLDVYSLESEPKLLFSMADVQSTLPADDNIIIATNSAVYSINPKTKSGSIQMSFGKYTYCGLQPAGQNYTICILDSENNSSSLLIQPDVVATDFLDRDIQTLRELPQVESVSVYGQFIYITQYTGEAVYDPAQKGFTTNQKTADASKARIEQVIDELGIDRNTYTITYNY